MRRSLALLPFMLAACGPPGGAGGGAPSGPPPGASLEERARAVHRAAIVVDGHNDITLAIVDQGFDLGRDGTRGRTRTHTDLRRLKAGGLGAVFFAIYVDGRFTPRTPGARSHAYERARAMIAAVQAQTRAHPRSLALATTAADVARLRRSGKVAVLLGLEGGLPIENSLEKLRAFHALGVRYMTLTHWSTTEWADSSGDLEDPAVKHHDGLTDFGREIVREMNRLGMLVDVSHVADRTFFDVLATSRAPVIASHSSVRALADHPRNLTDEMLRALARNGGVAMINFFDGFIDRRKAEVVKHTAERRKQLQALYPKDAARVNREIEAWWASHGFPRTPLATLVDHLEHAVRVAGVDHVGLGSDFDGVPHDMVPEGLDDVAGFPAITLELLRRGHSPEGITKILGGNLLRVLAAAERLAAHPPTPK
ncbi:MAG: membrane dipeptidase [Deltaproteobacteria bacterium]|nr:membrane dipeptidase [Deltaproteobacteria bacterium]